MISGRAVCLMYHELELPDRSLCQPESGYVRYVVSIEDFRQQMKSLKAAGLRGISVTQLLDGQAGVALTFDDGCETDLIAAAPLLREYDFSATFYITVGFLGNAGYLRSSQVRELAANAVDIGCHSSTHPYLTDLNEAGLHREIVEAKDSLQQITGRSVEHFSCPGGRWDPRVAEVARKAGYRSVATSQTGINSRSTDPFRLCRISIMRGTPLSNFRRLASGRGLWPIRLREKTRSAVRSALGNSVYDRLRARLLKDA